MRARKPWYRAGKNSWYVTFEDGQQKSLGINNPNASKETIENALRDLLRRVAAESAPNAAPRTINVIVGQFLADAGERIGPRSLSGYRYYLDDFAAKFGAEVPPLRPEPVEAWSRKPTWSQSTRHNALKTVAMLMRWAGCPIRLRVPSKTSAGAEKVVVYPDYVKLLAATSGDFRSLIKFLWFTGCRPSEACRIHPAHVDLAAGCVLLSEHKTVQKTGRVRTIFLCTEAAEVMREQLAKYPSGGPLFRGERGGQAFTRHGLVCRFGHLAERTSVKVTAYSFRHSLACRALAQGIPDAHVAALLGHVNTAMIHKNYGHLSAQSRVLKEAAERIRSA